jgi:hypothetical protein
LEILYVTLSKYTCDKLYYFNPSTSHTVQCLTVDPSFLSTFVHSKNDKAAHNDMENFDDRVDQDGDDAGGQGVVPPVVDDRNRGDAVDDTLDGAGDDSDVDKRDDNNNDDQFYNAAKGAGSREGEEHKVVALPGPVVGPAGALGAEQAGDSHKDNNLQPPDPKMEVVKPPRNPNIDGPDGHVNVDNIDVARIGRGQGVILEDVQPAIQNPVKDDNYYDDKDDDEMNNDKESKLLNAIKPPGMAGHGL